MAAAIPNIEFTNNNEGLTFVAKTISFRLKPLAKKRLYIDALQKNLINALHLRMKIKMLKMNTKIQLLMKLQMRAELTLIIYKRLTMFCLLRRQQLFQKRKCQRIHHQLR